MQEDVSSAQQGGYPEDVLSWEKTWVLGSICLQLAVHYDGGGHASSGELSPAPHQRMQNK